MVFYFLFVLSLFLSYCLDIERRVCWLMLAGNPEYFSLWQFNSVRQFHVRPAVAALSQSGPRSGICRLKTLRFHVEACLVLPGPGRGGEFHNLWVTPGTPSSHPSLRENVDPGKVPWPCLDVWTPEIAPSVQSEHVFSSTKIGLVLSWNRTQIWHK